MTENIIVAIREERHMGSATFSMIFHSPASSIRAASKTSGLICRKDWRSRKIPKALAPKGRIWGKSVSMSLAFENIRYTLM